MRHDYTEAEWKKQGECLAHAQKLIRIRKWLKANPEVGVLHRVGSPDNKAFYYHDEKRTYIEIEAFGIIPQSSKWTFLKEVNS